MIVCRRIALALAAAILAGLAPAVSPAVTVRAAASVAFHVTVTGTAHESGTIAAPMGQLKTLAGSDFNGCAIVKHTNSAAVGAYTFEIHVNRNGGLNLLALDIQPSVQQELVLRIVKYLPTVASYDTSTVPVEFAFALNGRVYGFVLHGTVRVRNGGKDGTISSPDGYRLYPAVQSHPLHGVNIVATWHCSTVYTSTMPF